MKHFIINITVSAKKGDKQETKWLVEQDIEYNYIEQSGYWRNHKNELKEEYTITLLKKDIDLCNMQNDKNDHAGFNGNAGIIYKNRDLGEIVLTCRKWHKEDLYIYINSYSSETTKSEREFLANQVFPHVKTFIEENKSALMEEAVKRCYKQMKVQLEQYALKLERLKKKMEEMFKGL